MFNRAKQPCLGDLLYPVPLFHGTYHIISKASAEARPIASLQTKFRSKNSLLEMFFSAFRLERRRNPEED